MAISFERAPVLFRAARNAHGSHAPIRFQTEVCRPRERFGSPPEKTKWRKTAARVSGWQRDCGRFLAVFFASILLVNSSQSLTTKRRERVHFGCAPRRKPTRQQRHAQQQ